ncbi:MAG: PilN domain-containing protein [Acidobacteria bacterium]|nr:PilN domain-containing protein [Acidobacteriota bacterium]MDW7984123.1 PilN domain-containing protein [Acidobacteriota bacterium]
MIEINLISPPRVEPTERAEPTALPGLVGGLLVLALGLAGIAYAYMTLSNRLQALGRQVAEAQAKLESLKPVLNKVGELQQRKDAVERRFQAIDALARSRTLPGHVLMDLARSMPELAWLSRFSATGGSFVAEGFARQERALTDLVNHLNRTDYFENVRIVSWEVPPGQETGKFVINGAITNPLALPPAETSPTPRQ